MVKNRRIISFIIIFILGFIFASLVLGVSASYDKSDSAVAGQTVNSAVNTMTSYDMTYDDMEMEELVVEESAAEDMMVYSTASNTESAAGAAVEKGNEVSNDIASRKLIKTYHLSFETEAFDEAKAQLEQLMGLTGAYAESADLSVASWNHNFRNYYLTIRVPSDKTEAFLNQSSSFGTLTNRSEQIEDVTLDYVDIEAHKESLQVEYDRVVELLKEAEDLEQILLLESKLSDLRYRLDSYESRLRTYDNLIDYTTIYLSIQEVRREEPKTFGERISSGFATSIENLGNAFINLIVFIVSNILTITVVIVLFWIGFCIIRKAIKKNKKNKIEIIEK